MLCYFSPVPVWSQGAQSLEEVAQGLAQSQQGPAATQPSPEEVLSVVNQLLGAGFTIFSQVYGAVNAVNPATGEVSTASGTVQASEAGPLQSTPPGGGRGDTVTFDPAPEQTFYQQLGDTMLGDLRPFVWILGAGVLAAVILR